MDCASISYGTVRRYEGSVRASSPIWASEASLVRTSVLARLVSLAQIGELARTNFHLLIMQQIFWLEIRVTGKFTWQDHYCCLLIATFIGPASHRKWPRIPSTGHNARASRLSKLPFPANTLQDIHSQVIYDQFCASKVSSLWIGKMCLPFTC